MPCVGYCGTGYWALLGTVVLGTVALGTLVMDTGYCGIGYWVLGTVVLSTGWGLWQVEQKDTSRPADTCADTLRALILHAR